MAAGIVAPSICLLLVPSYRPRMLLVLALMIATAASAGAVPGMAETRAMGLARQRVADVKQLEDRLSIGLTEAVFDAALLSPMKSTVSLPASKRAIVCYAEKRGDRYALVVTPYASFFPDDWEMTSLDAASYVFVLHDGIEVKRPLRAVEAPVLVYRLPDYELVASGSVSLGLWHRADADPFGWSDVHKLRSLMAQVVRILVGAKP